MSRPSSQSSEITFRRKRSSDQTDVAADHPDQVQRLSAQLAAWKRKVEAERLADDSMLAATVGAEEMERLRSLGYVQ